MQKEGRIARADKRIRARVSTNSKVAAAVHAELTVHVARVRLHDGLEPFDGGILEDQAGGVEERSVLGGDTGVEITLETAGVVVQGVGNPGGRGGAVLREGDGANVYDHVGERARGDAAAASSGREGDKGGCVEGFREDEALVGDEVTVTPEGGVGAVKDGRGRRVGNIETPFPVGDGTGVAARGAEFLLVRPGEVAVPGEEDAREVNVQGLHEVDGDKVVKEGDGAREGDGVEQTRLGAQTLDGGDIALALGLGEGSPFLTNPEVAGRAGAAAAELGVGNQRIRVVLGEGVQIAEGITLGDLSRREILLLGDLLRTQNRRENEGNGPKEPTDLLERSHGERVT